MTKLSLVLVGACFLSAQAFAAGQFLCKGSHNGTNLIIKGHMPTSSITSLPRAFGTISVNNREVAKFQEGDMKVNFFRKSFKVNTNHGDSIIGKFVDIGDMKARVDVKIPAYGIEISNFPVTCK